MTDFLSDPGASMSQFIFWVFSSLTEDQAPGLVSIGILIAVVMVGGSANRKLTSQRHIQSFKIRTQATVRNCAFFVIATLAHPASSQDIAEACERVAIFQFGLSDAEVRDVQSFPELDPPRVRIRISGEAGQQDPVAQALGMALGRTEGDDPMRVDYGQVYCQFEDPEPPFGLVAFDCSGPDCPVSTMRLEELRVLLHREYAAEGEPYVSASEAIRAAPASEEQAALIDAVQPCWNIGVLSREALRVAVTVGFSLTDTGRHEQGSIRLISATGGDDQAAAQAFETARRAIIRCEADGYPDPSNYNGDVRLLFDGANMEIRSED